MLSYIQVKRYENLDFDDYLKIKSYSFSTLKSTKDGIRVPVKVTDKMTLGKLVDEIRTENKANFSHPMYPIARDIAAKMKAEIGDINLSFQNSYEGIIHADGLILPVKGRTDAELMKLAIMDYKVNHSCRDKSDVKKLVEFMGYDNQLWNYGKLAGIDNNYFLFMYSTKAKKTFFEKLLKTQLEKDICQNWWYNQVAKYGIKAPF